MPHEIEKFMLIATTTTTTFHGQHLTRLQQHRPGKWAIEEDMVRRLSKVQPCEKRSDYSCTTSAPTINSFDVCELEARDWSWSKTGIIPIGTFAG